MKYFLPIKLIALFTGTICQDDMEGVGGHGQGERKKPSRGRGVG